MSNERYDVFISHRRREGWAYARLIYYALKDYGYEAYLDVENPKAGQIDEILFKVIENCDHFVIVLTPGALDGCWDERDWVRLEVEKARSARKNIIPVLMDGFSFPKEMPESMEFLRKQGGLTVSRDYYGSFVSTLVEMMKSPPQIQEEKEDKQTSKDIHTTEISEWADVLAAIDDGTIQQRYKVGDCVPLDLDRFGKINMQLAGFDLDERADGKGKAATTWIAKELLPEEHKMCEDWGNWPGSGWAGSDLRIWLREQVLPAFPDELNKGKKLVPVIKRQRGSLDSVDRLWIPDKSEVFGKDSLYYGLFQNKASCRVKKRTGSAAVWWLRSASYDYDYAYYVGSRGSDTRTNVYDSRGVALGFCL